MEIKPILSTTKFTKNDVIQLPIMHLPLFRSQIAVQNEVASNILLRTWGGLGDQICAEPTLRHALKYFRDVEVSLDTEKPELFRHLKFKKVYDSREVQVNQDKFFVLETITPPDDSNLVWQFFSHLLTNCVDFPALCALRRQLPVEEREILMCPVVDPYKLNAFKFNNRSVFIHAGKHWPSKTFPKDWWDNVIGGLLEKGVPVVLIGADTDDNRGTVDVNATGCLDLRNKLSIEESLWLCQHARVLLTNDSSPMHMAASRDPNDTRTGQTWIGYIATCKHPDYITHYRRRPDGKLEWQWREENLGLGGMWELGDYCPNKDKEIKVDLVDPEILRSWLPEPERVVEWTLNKLTQD